MSQVTYLYNVFHLNLAFSSIEEDARKDVVEKCYWPLLDLANNNNLPIGLEATGFTLEEIERISPQWIKKLADLIKAGKVEFIGSGYSQLIGPTVPPKVNSYNLTIGDMIYQSMLGIKPTIALVNEQAFSPGMVDHYIQHGYDTIIMDWAEPASHHPHWTPDIGLAPQIVRGHDGNEINILWSNALIFQQFQRIAHDQITPDAYFHYLEKLLAQGARAIPLYTSDAEIFDYRPGRFSNEALLSSQSEWARIEAIFDVLNNDDRFKLVLPSDALSATKNLPKHHLKLESNSSPITVKKQRKYNVNRWSLTGRNDLAINTGCWRIYQNLIETNEADLGQWKTLCYLWSSDFRTHITDARWQSYRKKLGALTPSLPRQKTINISEGIPDGFVIHQDNYAITIKNQAVTLTLSPKRGLAIDAFKRNDDSQPHPWMGTIPHGFYDDIAWGADFYSGHLTIDRPGQHKITDLGPTKPQIYFDQDQQCLVVTSTIETNAGPIVKHVQLFEDGKLTIGYEGLKKLLNQQCICHLGQTTLNPLVFNKDTLFFSCANGHKNEDTHYLEGKETISHAGRLSLLVSANTAMAATNQCILIGDEKRQIALSFQKADAALMAMIHYDTVKDGYFARLLLSASEIDDTRKSEKIDPLEEMPLIFSYSVDLIKK